MIAKPAKIERMITVGQAVELYERTFREVRELIDLDDTISPDIREAMHRVIDEQLLLAKESMLRGRRQ